MDRAYQAIALTILAMFYACYFIKALRQRKKGIKTDHMGEGKTGFVKFVELTLKLVTILIPVVEAISIVLNTTVLSVPLRNAGCVTAFLGTLVFAASVITMRDSWRAGVSENEKTELITGGIYRISRNPAFLGFDLVYIGILLAFFNWLLCVLSMIGILMFHLQIVNVEEDFLIETFGEAYLDYRKHVCRYFGIKP